MPRTPPPANLDEGEDDLTVDDSEEEGSKPSPRGPKSSRPSNVRSTRLPPIRRWRSSESEPDSSEAPGEEGSPRTGKRGRPPQRWRARDSLYFAPLVALAIIIVLVVGAYGYTQNWPPVYVVESSSMQHGSADQVGAINAGDLVFAQKVPASQIVTYVVGMGSGHSTYGEYGDVILYSANGQGGTPVIHRPLVYVDWNSSTSTFSIPELQGLACGSSPNATYSTSSTSGGCGWNDLPNDTVLTLNRIGWQSATVRVTLGSVTSGSHSGFLTMGDNNLACAASPCQGEIDQGPAAISQIVEPGWVIGVARGMIPWVGSLKLLVEGNAGTVPTQSWQFLGLTVAVLIGAAFAIHYAVRVTRPMDPRRAAQQEAAEEEAEEADSEDRGKRFWSRFSFHREKKDEEDIDAPASRRKFKGGGRPKPSVRRAKDSGPSKKDDDRL